MTRLVWPGGAAGATANDTAIKPLECVPTFLACIPKWPAQFSGQVLGVTEWSYGLWDSVCVCVCVCVCMRTCQKGVHGLLN